MQLGEVSFSHMPRTEDWCLFPVTDAEQRPTLGFPPTSPECETGPSGPDDQGVGRSRQLQGGKRRSNAQPCIGDVPRGNPDTSSPGTGAPRAYLLEPLDLVFQLDLSGPGVELAEAGG